MTYENQNPKHNLLDININTCRDRSEDIDIDKGVNKG